MNAEEIDIGELYEGWAKEIEAGVKSKNSWKKTPPPFGRKMAYELLEKLTLLTLKVDKMSEEEIKLPENEKLVSLWNYLKKEKE